MLTKNLLATVFIWVIFTGHLLGQVPPSTQADFNKTVQIIPPSPNAASLGKYGGINVGLPTGTPSINIPLYDYSSLALKVPISLSYTSSGLKVDEIASRVGMGWALNAGGVITRTVYGAVDENTARMTPSPGVQDRNFYNLVRQIGESNTNSLDPSLDGQPDLYHFNFGGNTGTFFMSDSLLPNGTNAGQPVLLTYSNLKFDHALDTSAGYNIRAIDGEGVQFLFKASEYTTSTTDLSSSLNCGVSSVNPVVTSWYLYRIIHPCGDTVTLSYLPIEFHYITGATQTIYQLNGPSLYHLGTIPEDVSAPNLLNTLCISDMKTKGVLLDQIVSTAGGKVKFNYINRNDYNDRLLSSIAIYQPDSLNSFKTFVFNYETPSSLTMYASAISLDSLRRRPFLVSVTERSPDSTLTKSYKFLYQDFGSLPSRLSYAQDHWGYFNGKNNSTFIPVPQSVTYQQNLPLATANRNPDPVYAQKGLLASITYPTGGKDSIFYEGNVAPQLVAVPNPPDTISVTSTGLGGTFTSNPFQVAVGQIIKIYGWRNNQDIGDSVRNFNDIYILDAAGHTVYSNSMRTAHVYEVNLIASLQPGTYRLRIEVSGFNASGNARVIYSPGTPSNQMMSVTVGGVRVQKIETYDNITSTPLVKKYYYDEGYTNQVYNYEKNHVLTLRALDYAPTENCNYLMPFTYYSMYSNCINNLYVSSGSPVTYANVTEGFGNNFDNGGIEHKFTVAPNTPPQILFGSTIQGAINVDNSYLNGREVYSKTFRMLDTSRIPVSERFTTFKIDTGASSISQYGYIIKEKYVYPCPLTGTVIPEEWAGFDVSYYKMDAHWMYVDSIRTLTYSADGSSSFEESEKYEYANRISALPTKTTRYMSDGRPEVTNSYYPTDLLLSGTPEIARQMLVANHIVTPLLQQAIIKGSASTYKIKTEYALFSNGYVLPASSSTMVLSAPWDKRVSFYKYNRNAKIVEQGKESDARSVYIWDYYGKYPIAEVLNADSASVAYTSFEADGTGNWTIGSPARISGGAVTGSRWYSLNSDVSKSGMTAGSTYIVSYWTKNASAYSISGTLSGYPVKGKTVNGWTFYLHRVTGQTLIKINGTGGIDEVRLYPVTATMTSYTFEPLIGMTSQSDATGKIIYYEYDGLQRLLRIRDMDGYIVKQYEYKYQAAAGCGANCSILTMTNLAGVNTLSYPVGVFNVNGKLLGNASSQAQFVSLWNADTANANRGSLAAGGDSMHFNFTLIPGKQIPAITGCRFYQIDLEWTKIDGIRASNGAYVDFGDGVGMRLPAKVQDSVAVLPANTVQMQTGSPQFNNNTVYFVHTYSNNSLKTMTFYHNDGNETCDLDNAAYPATSMSLIKNRRGNIPQHLTAFGASSYQQATMNSIAGITNWSTIHSIQEFGLNSGDQGTTTVKNVSYPQDFMAGNPDLTAIRTARNFIAGYYDTSFKISKLKSDWNTYFTHLQTMSITDAHWNRENLSGLKELSFFYILPARTLSTNDPTGNPEIPLPSSVVDSIFIQIAAGAGQTISNGFIAVFSAGGGRTAASTTAINSLLAKGWALYLDEVPLH